MTNLALFALALVTIFAVPGPTNAMLLVTGAQRGVRRSLPVIGATVTAYILSVGLLYHLGNAVIAELTSAATYVKLALGAYLLVIAWQTWKFEMVLPGADVIEARQLFVVTALNPKTLVIAFAVFPPLLSPAELAPYATIFLVFLVIAVGTWIAAGSLLQRLPRAAGSPAVFRLLAVGLSVLAGVLALTAVRDLVA